MIKVLTAPALGLVVLSSCEPPKRPAPQPPLVTIGKTQTRDVTDYQIFVGRTEAYETVEVRARVEGFLKTIEFEPGKLVDKDKLLFTIEPDFFNLAVTHAEAALSKNKAELDRAEADLERVELAVKTNAVSRQEVSLHKAHRDKARANVESAQARLADAKLKLSYTHVTSPIAGRVSRNLRDVGNLVGSGEKTLLATVKRLDPIFVYFDISAVFLTRYLREKGINRDSSKQEKNLGIAISLSGDQGFPHEGYIDYFDNTADSETGTIPVRGVLANTAGKLYPGLFARVRVPGATIADAVLVRDAAIGTDLAGKFLLTVGDNNIVERRYMALGPLQDGWRVITEGIGPGEEYIVDGIIRARPGLPVRTQAEAAVAGTNVPAAKDPSKKDRR